MSQNYKKIINLLDQLDASQYEKDEMMKIFLFMSAQELEDLIIQAEKDPSLLKEIFNNYKQKKEILEKGDEQAWQEMIKKEA